MWLLKQASLWAVQVCMAELSTKHVVDAVLQFAVQVLIVAEILFLFYYFRNSYKYF